MSVISQPGQGSVFQFDIRVSIADAGDVPARQPARGIIALKPGQPRFRILIADDRQDNRLLLTKLLAPLGFEIHEAENVQETVRVWETLRPHLICMDIQMPVTDGCAAAKMIRKLETRNSKPETRNLKLGTSDFPSRTIIIALSASVPEEKRQDILAAGCDDFLLKPFRDIELFEMMEKYFGVRYIREQEASSDPARNNPDIGNALTRDALGVLPPDLLNRLRYCSALGDITESYAVIEEIGRHDSALADGLMTLADDFEYGRILRLIQEAKE